MTCQIILLVPLITEAVESLPESTTGFVYMCVWVRYQVQSAGQILAQGCWGGTWIGGVGVSGWKGGGAANVWVINFGRCNE